MLYGTGVASDFFLFVYTPRYVEVPMWCSSSLLSTSNLRWVLMSFKSLNQVGYLSSRCIRYILQPVVQYVVKKNVEGDGRRLI